jgi:hypothetical protein
MQELVAAMEGTYRLNGRYGRLGLDSHFSADSFGHCRAPGCLRHASASLLGSSSFESLDPAPDRFGPQPIARAHAQESRRDMRIELIKMALDKRDKHVPQERPAGAPLK